MVSAKVTKGTLGFEIMFPSSMYRSSDVKRHVNQGGIVCTTLLSTAEMFEGDSGSSTLRKMTAKLQIVQTQRQRTINNIFPANKPTQA